MIGVVALKRALLFFAFLLAVLLPISLALGKEGQLWKKLVGPVGGAALGALIVAKVERKPRRTE